MWTPQDEAEYQSLKAQYGAPAPVSAPSEPRRLGAVDQADEWATRGLQQAGNFAGNVARHLTSPLVNLANIGMEPEERQTALDQYQSGLDQSANTNRNFGASTGKVDDLIDIGGTVAPALYSLIIPGGAVSKGARILGAGATGASIAGDVAAGAYSGMGDSPQEAALQAGEFGIGGAALQLAGRRFGGVGRAVVGGLANAGAAGAVELARGHDLSSKEALTHLATNALFPAAMEGAGAVARRFGRSAEIAPTEPIPETLPSEVAPPIEREIPRRLGDYDSPGFEGQPAEVNPSELIEPPRRLGDYETPEMQGQPIESELPPTENVVDRPRGLRPLDSSRAAAIDPVLAAHLTGAAIGGAVGAYTDDENRGRGAVLGALGGAGLVAGGRRLIGMNLGQKLDDAARTQLKGGKPSMKNDAARFIQKNVIGDSEDLKTLRAQAQGEAQSEQQKFMRTINNGQKELATLPLAQRQIVSDYVDSPGLASDEAKLSSLNPKTKEVAMALRQGKQFGKVAQIGGTADKERQTMLGSTDDYVTGAYRARLDPENHVYDEARIQSVTDENMELPEYKGMSRAEVEDDVRNFTAQTRASALGKPDVPGGTTRMDKTMYMQKKALNADEVKILENLSNDPRLTSAENAEFSDMLANGMTPKTQARVREMAKDPRINHVELLKTIEKGLTPKEGMWIKAALNKKAVPPEAFEMLEKMATNPKVPPAYQNRLLELVNDAKSGSHRTFHTDEADALMAIGKKSILSENRKQLLGVVEDPLEKQFLTVRKLLNDSQKALTVGKLLTDSNSSGRYHLPKEDWSQALITAEKAGDKASIQKLTDYVDVPDGPQFGGLAGGKVQREVADSLQIGPNHKGLDPMQSGIMAYANAIPKIAFTRLNPAAHMHNAVSSALQGTAMGVVNPIKIASHWKKVLTDPDIRTELEHNGILGSGVGSDMNRTAQNFDAKLNPTRFGKLKEAASNVMDKINHIYGYSDNVMRAAGYLQNKPRFMKAGAADGLTGDALEKFAQHETTKFVNRFSNNYGQVSNLTRTLSNVPLVNPFIRYQEQNLKVIKNLAHDLIKGTAEDQKRAAIALTVFMAVPAAAYAGMKAMLGKDEKEYSQMEKTMPDYMRARLQVPTSKNQETGEFNSVNLQPWMPSGDIVAFAKNILHGDAKAILANNPLFGLNQTPALNILTEQASGRDSFTDRKFNDTGDRIHSITKNFTPSWFPGNYAADKLETGFSENDKGERGLTDSRTGKRETPGTAVASLFGFSKSIQSPKRLADRLKRDADETISSYRSEMRSVLRSNINEESKQEARQLFQKRREKVMRRFNEQVGK